MGELFPTHSSPFLTSLISAQKLETGNKTGFILFPEEDDDNEDLSDMEEGDADASTSKQASRKQQVQYGLYAMVYLCHH